MDKETNNDILKLAEDNGVNSFWLGIYNDKYASDNTSLLWSNQKPKELNHLCDDNVCPCLGPGCDEFDGELDGDTQISNHNFGKWVGKCCSVKKFGAVCDKKIGKFFEINLNNLALWFTRHFTKNNRSHLFSVM